MFCATRSRDVQQHPWPWRASFCGEDQNIARKDTGKNSLKFFNWKRLFFSFFLGGDPRGNTHVWQGPPLGCARVCGSGSPFLTNNPAEKPAAPGHCFRSDFPPPSFSLRSVDSTREPGRPYGTPDLGTDQTKTFANEKKDTILLGHNSTTQHRRAPPRQGRCTRARLGLTLTPIFGGKFRSFWFSWSKALDCLLL